MRPTQYSDHASFVSKLGTSVVDLLGAKPGEQILDLGCGDGTLGLTIEKTGAKIIGVDSSPEMVGAARDRGLTARVMSGNALTFSGDFDAVFSNAALHWMKDYQAVIRGVNDALKPGGRFVAEFGAEGNVRCIVSAIEIVMKRNPEFGAFKNPWFFTSEEAYANAPRQGGLTIETIAVSPRPTPLATGVREWLKIFADHVISGLDDQQTERFLTEVEQQVHDRLYSPQEGWFADYVRLRFLARKST